MFPLSKSFFLISVADLHSRKAEQIGLSAASLPPNG
jgi:hypothetical protein